MKTLILFIVLIFSLTVNSFSQEGHYWIQQFGSESMLLSGSVIGGVNDLGAVFYNPARISRISNPVFLLSAQIYELKIIKFNDAFGSNKNADVSEFGGVPSLAAGTFKVPFLGKHYFAWAVLTRQKSEVNLGFKEEVFDDVVDFFPGKEHFGAEIKLSDKAKEDWYCLSWAYRINEKLSIGASTYLSAINDSKGININLQALAENNEVAIYRFAKNISFKHYRLLWKLGLSYQKPKVHAGLTLMTPSIKMKGKGAYQNELFYSGINDISNGTDIYSSTNQKNLTTNFFSPWSLGAGITFLLGKSKLHLSSEWFSSMKKYNIIQTDPYIGQSNADTSIFKLVSESKSIINGGIGVEIYINQKVSFFTSFSTDFSTLANNIFSFTENKEEAFNSTFNSDLYHYGAGIVMDFKGADITLGLTYTGTSISIPRPFNFPVNPEDPIFGPNDQLTAKWNRWRLAFGFSLPFLMNLQKKAEEKFGF